MVVFTKKFHSLPLEERKKKLLDAWWALGAEPADNRREMLLIQLSKLLGYQVVEDDLWELSGAVSGSEFINKKECGPLDRIVCIHASARDLDREYILNETDCVCTDCLDQFMAGKKDPDTLQAICGDSFAETVAALGDRVL